MSSIDEYLTEKQRQQAIEEGQRLAQEAFDNSILAQVLERLIQKALFFRLRESIKCVEACGYTCPKGGPLALNADWQELRRIAGMEEGK